MTWLVIGGGFLALNLLTLLAFGHDKRAAIRGGRRVPERRLLLLAALGGSPAAIAGMRMFRHKRAKAGFRRRVQMIALAQAALLATLLAARLAEDLSGRLAA